MEQNTAKIMDILYSFKASNPLNYYPHTTIPYQKLRNAIEFYPVDRQEATFLGLIDTTVFGSAKSGMLLGGKGVYWKNSWGSPPAIKNFLSWEELVKQRDKIIPTFNKLQFDIGIEFTSTVIDSTRIKNSLLLPLISIYMETPNVFSIDSKPTVLSVSAQTKPTDAKSVLSALSNNNKTYQTALINSFALMAFADGSIQEEEVDVVIKFIEADGDITDKAKIIENFTSIIKELEEESSKSKAFLKLRINKSLGEIRKLTDNELREKVFIMVEGVFDSKENSGGIKIKRTPEEIEMLNKLKKELSPL